MNTLNWLKRLPGLLVVSLILFGVIATTPVFAQSNADAEKSLEEVLVTGSRIRQDPLNERLPVLTFSQKDYQESGASSLAEYIQRLPISGSAINATNNSSGNLGFPPDGGGIGAGAAEIDLRYLTSKRVLVLVDGKRWIKGSSGSGVSGAVDLNSIPVNAIKSIEILQDGASTIYGSDALGGVVNIITSDDYNSLKASAYYGQYKQGDGQTQEYDVRFGAGGERGRALIDISYADQQDVSTADRSQTQYPLPGFPYGVSSAVPGGRFIFFDPAVGDYVSVTPNAGVADPQYPQDFHHFGLADRFNYQPYNHLVTPNERLNVFAKGEYDITDTTQAHVLASFNNRKSQGQAAPVPLFWGPDAGSTAYMNNVVWDKDQIYNPFGMDLGPNNLSFMTHRPVEMGPRIFNQDVDTWYVSSGLDGEFGSDDNKSFWDITAIWAENNATQTKLNQFNARSLSVALGDPSVCSATPGCVPLNIVGANSMTPEMLDFVTYTGVDTSSQKMFDFTANLAGDLFEMPAGSMGYAIGYEYREEKGTFTPDPVVAAGETADVPTTPTVGKFDVNEVYGEVIMPLLADKPGAESLNLSAAVRWSKYNLFNSETVYKLGLNWAPTEDWMVRTSYSTGYRAPNIGELFNQGGRFDSGISDNCSNVTPEYAANCAALGVPANYVQLNPQISVDTGGNINLQPEKSKNWTAGFTWDVPVGDVSGIKGFLTEVNYYNIKVDDAIQPPRAQDLLDGCIDTLESIFCDAVHRNPSGTISSIEGTLLNIGGIKTDGLDVNFDLTLDETSAGTFEFQWMNTWLLSYDELIVNSTGGQDKFDRKGYELGSPTRGFPEWKSTFATNWSLNDWYARLAFRYQSSLTEQCTGLVQDFEQTQLCSDGPDTNKLGSVIYTDLQVSWNPSSFNDGRWTFSAGVNNLLNEKPPTCFSCDLNSMDGTLYAIAGQFWYLRAVFEMGGGEESSPAKSTPPPPPPPPPAAPPPNPDLDGDGVLNEKDKCPNTRKGAVVDLDGCEVEAVISLEGVHFEFNKATLTAEAKAILDKAAGLLKTHERVVVEVAGHTDSVGSEEYNQKLSERRAIAVKDYLESQGITATRLTARGYGETQPVASNDTDAGRALNRRVELIVLSR